MADSPISGLPETTTVGDDDLILLEQNSTAKKVSGRNWKQYFNANVISASATTVEPTLSPTATFNQLTKNLALTLPSADYIDTVTKTGSSGLTDTYTITSKLGHTGTFTVTNGAGDVNTVNTKPADGSGNVSITADDIPTDDSSSVQTHIGTVEQDIQDMITAIGTKASQTTVDGIEQKVGSVTLSKTWTNSNSGYYTQTVTISGATITANTKVDVQPDETVLVQMATNGTSALFIKNNNSTLTAYAIGEKPNPSASITVQVTYYETTA